MFDHLSCTADPTSPRQKQRYSTTDRPTQGRHTRQSQSRYPRIGRPEAQPEAQSSKTSSYDPTKDYLYRAYLAATIIGVIGAFLGIAAIYHRTRETARSARAAEESIALQKVAQKQWVNISRWSISKTPDRDWVEIGCLISNPTHVPLTLNSTMAQVGGETPSKQFVPQIIAPKIPSSYLSLGIWMRATLSKLVMEGFPLWWKSRSTSPITLGTAGNRLSDEYCRADLELCEHRN
jgi:hypothetical protein